MFAPRGLPLNERIAVSVDRVQLIETGLASQFWKEIIEPLLTARQMSCTAALRDPSIARKHSLPDDYIRGILDLAEMLLNQPKLIAESERAAEIEERINAKREAYDDAIAHYGRGSLIDESTL
jgi:hypothetical protein